MFGLRTRYSFEGYRSKRLFCEAVVSSRGKPGRHLLRSTGMAFDSPGFFTGALTSTDSLPHDDVRRTHPRFSEENLKKNLTLLQPIEEIAREKGCTPAQLALAWLLAEGNDIVPSRSLFLLSQWRFAHHFAQLLDQLTVHFTYRGLRKLPAKGNGDTPLDQVVMIKLASSLDERITKRCD